MSEGEEESQFNLSQSPVPTGAALERALRMEGYGGGYPRNTLSEPPRGTQREYDLQDRLAQSAPPEVLLDMVADDVNEALRGNPNYLINFFREGSRSRSRSRSRSPSPNGDRSRSRSGDRGRGRSPNQVESQYNSEDPFGYGAGLSELRAMGTIITYTKMRNFLKGFGRVLLGAAYTGLDGAKIILGKAIEKGGVALDIVAQYASDVLRPHAAPLNAWAQKTADIAKMDIRNPAEFTAVADSWRTHLGKLPQAGTVLRLVSKYGWGVLSRVGSIGSIVGGHLFSLLYKVLSVLLTAPGSIDYEATASFIIEIASLCLEYITGGLIAVGPGPNTIAQLIIFLMTVLALGDKLIPHLESAYDKAIELLRRLLEYLETQGVNVVDFINTYLTPFFQSGYALSEPLKALFQRATGLIFEGSVHTIVLIQFLTQISVKLAIRSPIYAERLMEIVKRLEERGGRAALPPAEAGGGAAPAFGSGRIRKSRKSSSKKGKSGKKGGAKVKTAKRSTPCKKSKGKKAKKSKKN